MFLPRGAVIAEELEKLAKETEFAAGYQRVLTPHIARESLYLKSGHLPYYAESMFPPMELEDKLPSLSRPAGFQPDEEEAEQDARPPSHAGSVTSDRYYLRAMNCPHHHKLFGSIPRSYRDLPLRLAEYGTCYRYEKSGELFGLMRGRLLHMNDAHLYMTPEQFEDEFNAVNEMYLNYFKLFGIEKYLMRFSTHDPSKLGQKFVDEPELWKRSYDIRNLSRANRHSGCGQAEQHIYLKAMNCPHHHKLFAALPRSYRDLPLRLRNTGRLSLRESGELLDSCESLTADEDATFT